MATRDDGRAGGAERFPRGPVAELLDGDDAAGTEQRPSREHQGHLTAARDEHVTGTDRQPPRAGEH